MNRIFLPALLLAVAALNVPNQTPEEQLTIIHAGALLAIPGQQPLRASSIVVNKGRIEGVYDGYLTEPKNAAGRKYKVEIIDLKDKFVMPGLGDAHVHLSFQRGEQTLASRATLTPAEITLQALLYARRTLSAGFTTVRDLASNSSSIFALRDAINAGKLVGPRILVSGYPISTTGGHGDFTPPYSNTGDAEHSGICDGAETCRRAVREQIKRGADVIKLMATGGIASGTGTAQQFTEEEMRAIIEAAHLRGKRVTTHAYDPQGLKAAVRAGVDSVEHGFFVDQQGLELMKQRGTWLIPTMVVMSARNSPNTSENHVQRARKTGVRIAFGTDSGMTPHGENAKEFSLLVQAGLTPMEALTAATVSVAQVFELEKEIGTLEPGKLADIIAVQGNPLDNIAAMQNVSFVMKSGVTAKRNGALLPFD